MKRTRIAEPAWDPHEPPRSTPHELLAGFPYGAGRAARARRALQMVGVQSSTFQLFIVFIDKRSAEKKFWPAVMRCGDAGDGILFDLCRALGEQIMGAGNVPRSAIPSMLRRMSASTFVGLCTLTLEESARRNSRKN